MDDKFRMFLVGYHKVAAGLLAAMIFFVLNLILASIGGRAESIFYLVLHDFIYGLEDIWFVLLEIAMAAFSVVLSMWILRNAIYPPDTTRVFERAVAESTAIEVLEEVEKQGVVLSEVERVKRTKVLADEFVDAGAEQKARIDSPSNKE